MKKLLRRCTAALLAAGTIWVVAATAESSSAAAAVSAMRDSFHLQRLLVQLELGGAAGRRDESVHAAVSGAIHPFCGPGLRRTARRRSRSLCRSPWSLRPRRSRQGLWKEMQQRG